MKNRILFTVVLTFFSLNFIFGQSNQEWWSSLSPGWKQVFRNQELKGKNVDPNDEQLERIVNITHLDCSYNTDIEDLSPLYKLILLEELRCNNTTIKSLEGIEGLTNLKVLDCSNNDNIASLIPLAGIVTLEELNCGNTMVKNLGPLQGMKYLKKLDVSLSTVNKILVVSELKSLEVLDVSENLSLFDIEGVQKLPNLIEFYCADTRVDDLEPLSELENLQILDVSGSPVKTLRPIQNVRTLKELDCSDTQITGTSFDYLFGHFTLTMLRARNIKIEKEEIKEFEDYFKTNNPNCTVIISAKEIED